MMQYLILDNGTWSVRYLVSKLNGQRRKSTSVFNSQLHLVRNFIDPEEIKVILKLVESGVEL